MVDLLSLVCGVVVCCCLRSGDRRLEEERPFGGRNKKEAWRLSMLAKK